MEAWQEEQRRGGLALGILGGSHSGPLQDPRSNVFPDSMAKLGV